MDGFHDRLIALRHDLHRHPELGFEEHRTRSRIAACLRDLGMDVHEGLGVVGVLRAGTGNRAIGLRADMDALPITEDAAHDHGSRNAGVMHACGHDGHMAMLLGAAEQLVRSPDFDGTVVFLFQPNEENGLGARAMLDDGVLEKFPVDEIYAIHNLPGAPLGQISTRPGLICSSESLFEIALTGHGGHSAMPQTTSEAMTAGAELVLSLQTIVSRKLPPGSGAVVSVTEFLTDGRRNVLPGHVVVKGDARARNAQDREAIETCLRRISAGIATAHGLKANVSFTTEFTETINATGPTSAVCRVGQEAGLDIVAPCEPMSFSEDFAHFTAAVPGCFLLLGNGTTGAQGRPLHAADYDFNDALLPIGSDFWSALVRDRLPPRKD